MAASGMMSHVRSGLAGLCAAAAVFALAPRAGAQDATAEHPLAPALRLAEASREALQSVKDYEAAFSKRDVVNGQVYAHTMRIKYREEPSSVYMQFYRPHEGREVIYVAGRNGGKLLAHETGLAGLVGTVALDPDSPQAMSESRRPITRIGMKKMLDGVIEQWQKELQYDECEVKYYPNAKLREMECQVIEVRHPVPRKHFPYHMGRLFIDKKTKFPVRLENYGYPTAKGQQPPLIEEYTYWNIRPNIGLTDADFDPRNPKYGFN